MRERVLIVTIILLTGFALVANAQTNPVPVSVPFQLLFDHPGTNTTAFRCYVDSVKVGADVAVTAPRVCLIPGQPAGIHTLTVSAANAFGEAPSAGLAATAGGPPTQPTNLRITVQIAVQQDGSVTLLASEVARER